MFTPPVTTALRLDGIATILGPFAAWIRLNGRLISVALGVVFEASFLVKRPRRHGGSP
jgi:hypothetical protein